MWTEWGQDGERDGEGGQKDKQKSVKIDEIEQDEQQ